MAVKDGHTSSFDDVFTTELVRIRRIRRNKQQRHAASIGEAGKMNAAQADAAEGSASPAVTGPALIGLALSGGGIRSAAVSLGVMQAMASGDALRRCDYLSTVSGGGYIGSALTWFLSGQSGWTHGGAPSERRATRSRFGTAADDHPLGRREAGAKTGSANDRIDHIRGFGNYLKPIPELWAGSAVAMVLQRMTYMVMLWFFPLAFALLVLDGLGLLAAALGLPFLRYEGHLGGHLGWLWWLVAAMALVALLPRQWKPPTRIQGQFVAPPGSAGATERYAGRMGSQQVLGRLLAIAIGAGIVAVLPVVAYWFLPLVGNTVGGLAGAAGLAAAVFGAVGKLGGKRAAFLRGLAVRTGVVVLAIAMLVLAVAIPDLVARGLMPGAGTGGRLLVMVAFGLVAAAVAVFMAGWVRLNWLSLHRFYRDRLMETFLPQKPDIDAPQQADRHVGGAAQAGSELAGGAWQPAVRANAAAIKDMCDGSSLGPYHLINTNVILVGSKNSVVRNRGGESFLLSPLFVGSDVTGWKSTPDIYGGKEQLTLPTAMAISGAAANPNTGSGGAGLMRSLVASRLMMLFNVRLAYWLNNPHPQSAMNAVWVRLWAWLESRNVGNDRQARCLYPGVAAVAGITHKEDSGYVELSDGGHFENLGIYELVRRRVPLIVVVDAAQDESCSLGDLANAIERVRVDFGVRVDFAWKDYALSGLYPGGAGNRLIGGARVRLAERGWAIGRIAYPKMPDSHSSRNVPTDAGRLRRALVGNDADGAKAIDAGQHDGCLVYLKPTIRASLPPDVLAYRAAHPAFPHETTADQLFDELQFEAYRQLGLATMEDLLQAFETFPGPSPGQPGSDALAVQMARLRELVSRAGSAGRPAQPQPGSAP